MYTKTINLRNVVAIAISLAVMMMFNACVLGEEEKNEVTYHVVLDGATKGWPSGSVFKELGLAYSLEPSSVQPKYGYTASYKLADGGLYIFLTRDYKNDDIEAKWKEEEYALVRNEISQQSGLTLYPVNIVEHTSGFGSGLEYCTHPASISEEQFQHNPMPYIEVGKTWYIAIFCHPGSDAGGK